MGDAAIIASSGSAQAHLIFLVAQHDKNDVVIIFDRYCSCDRIENCIIIKQQSWQSDISCDLYQLNIYLKNKI